MTTKPADKQTNKLKSIIIPIPKQDINLNSKIKLIANHLNISNQNEITTITTIHQLFKNNPFKNTQHTQNQILSEIISINPTCAKLKTNSAINMIINRLHKAGVLNRIEGYYTLIPAFQGLNEVDQIVFRFK